MLIFYICFVYSGLLSHIMDTDLYLQDPGMYTHHFTNFKISLPVAFTKNCDWCQQWLVVDQLQSKETKCVANFSHICQLYSHLTWLSSSSSVWWSVRGLMRKTRTCPITRFSRSPPVFQTWACWLLLAWALVPPQAPAGLATTRLPTTTFEQLNAGHSELPSNAQWCTDAHTY